MLLKRVFIAFLFQESSNERRCSGQNKKFVILGEGE
jgi:hypothetical protein